jgi:hypothetical protein
MGCPHRLGLRFPLVQYSIPLQAPSASGSRLIITGNMEDSDSGISSDGQAQSHTEVNSNSFHGAESTQLQLIPHFPSLDLVNHVSQPQGFMFDIGTQSTRVAGAFPMQMHISLISLEIFYSRPLNLRLLYLVCIVNIMFCCSFLFCLIFRS